MTVYPRPFDLAGYLDAAVPDPRLLSIPEGRRQLTECDPLLFALTYMAHHLRDDSTGDQISFSDFHLDLAEEAINWIRPLRRARAFRDAYVSPRGSGKSTWLFLILPLWAGAHGHVRFIAAFADSATQAEQHLSSFRHELDTNDLLRSDFPDLTCPAVRPVRSTQLANSRGQITQRSGFTMMARGCDSAVAGMKVGRDRPQVILLDDIEPDESNYSKHSMEKRRTTLLDNILELNVFGRVVLSGTVTMPNSLVHQLVKTVTTTEEPEDWITDGNWQTHYYPAIVPDDDGTERSLWPQKWPIDDLQAIRHTRGFAKNYMNSPMAGDGSFWSPEDFRYDDPGAFGNTLLWIDPAVTAKVTSDYTGLAIVSQASGNTPPLYVRYARGVKLTPNDLRIKVLALLEEFDDIGLVVIETNQGGDAWKAIFTGLPVKIITHWSTAPKPVRIQRALVAYQRRLVAHVDHLNELEAQCCSYPNVANDDVVDAASCGIGFFLDRIARSRKATARTSSYM